MIAEMFCPARIECLRRSLRAICNELLTDDRAKLEDLGQKLTEEEEELIVNLSAAYIRKQQEWLEAGEQRGIMKGRQEGCQEGRQEGRQEMAIASLRRGLEIGLIAELTGLSIESIEQLQRGLEL